MDEPDDRSDSDRDDPVVDGSTVDPADGGGDALGDDGSADTDVEELGESIVDDADVGTTASGPTEGVGAPGDVEDLREEVRSLREELADFEESVDERTVHRSAIEDDLKRYVRSRLRRGHARGWGPYLVLLYGTAMTIGALYSPVLSGGWAIFAMFVIWLSTLGLYVLMLLVGAGIGLLSVPFKAIDAIRDRR